MNFNSIIDLYIKYGFISKENIPHDIIQELIDEDLQSGEFAISLISEIDDDSKNIELEYSLADGGWTSNNLIGEFYSNIESIIEMSKGSIQIENLKLEAPINKKGEEDEYTEMSISFSHNSEEHSWVFSRNDNDNFINGFTRWAYTALDGNFLYIEDLPSAYHLPKELIKELESFGVKNEVVNLKKVPIKKEITNRSSNLMTSDEIMKLFQKSVPDIHEEYIMFPDKERFLKLSRFATTNRYSIPTVLMRKSVSQQFVGVRPNENKIIAGTFKHISNVVQYISVNYYEINKAQNNDLDLIIYDTLSDKLILPKQDGTWVIKDHNSE